jgi:hypothetical protein
MKKLSKEGQKMNHQQILEQMLSFSLQQHTIKDKTIEDLQKQITDLQKQQDAVQVANKG